MILPYLIASWTDSQLWQMVPLLVAISLVYGATRHELMGPILHHAFKAAVWIAGFMAVIFVILVLTTWNL